MMGKSNKIKKATGQSDGQKEVKGGQPGRETTTAENVGFKILRPYPSGIQL